MATAHLGHARIGVFVFSNPLWHRPVTEDALRKIDRAEQFLKARGFVQVRVRHHEDIARIEVPPEDLPRFFSGWHKRSCGSGTEKYRV